MPFVIVGAQGKPLVDVAGDLIVLASRDEAQRWLKGERVERYVARRHSEGNGPKPVGRGSGQGADGGTGLSPDPQVAGLHYGAFHRRFDANLT
jgi:hypothetical protein